MEQVPVIGIDLAVTGASELDRRLQAALTVGSSTA